MSLHWTARVALSFLSGVLLVISFPHFDLAPLAWLGLVPMLIACYGQRPPLVFLYSYIAGLIYFAAIFYWIWLVAAYNVVDFIVLAAYLPQYFTVWALAVTWVRRRTNLPISVVGPSLWVALEYLRSHLEWASLPWMLLGHSQYSYPALTQIASITGVYGLSWIIVLTNTVIAEGISSVSARSTQHFFRRLPVGRLAVTALLVGGILLHGTFVLSRADEKPGVPIALIQGNIPQDWKWSKSNRQAILDRYRSLSHRAAGEGAAIIVWPETAVPGDVQHHKELRDAVARIAIETHAHILVGSAEYAKFSDKRKKDKLYNSMFLFSPAGTIEGQYRKIRLLPFGEYEPSGGKIRWPAGIIDAAAIGNFAPGDEHTIFDVHGMRLASLICWEAIFPDLVREFVAGGARLLVNATNEAWFYDTAAPYQLLAMTTFRAVEHRIPIVRAANTGVTAVIDPFGRITTRLKAQDGRELFVEGALVQRVGPGHGPTFYTRFGEVFAFLQIGLAAVLIGYACIPARVWRRHPAAASIAEPQHSIPRPGTPAMN